MEASITTAEQRVGELEQTLQDPAVFKDRAAEVPALVVELERRARSRSSGCTRGGKSCRRFRRVDARGSTHGRDD